MRTPSLRLPSTISVEPPPTSTTATSPSTTWPSVRVAPTNARRPSSCSLRISTGRPHARVISSTTSSRLAASRIAAVATMRIASASSSSASRTWVATASATSATFCGADRAVGTERLAQPGEGLLVHHAAQLAVIGLGDQHARGVRADVDRRAPHPGRPSCQRGQTCRKRRGAGAQARPSLCVRRLPPRG